MQSHIKSRLKEQHFHMHINNIHSLLLYAQSTHHTPTHLTTSRNNALLQPLALCRTHSFTQSHHTRNCDGRLAVSDYSLELLRLPAFDMAS
jgi:hypothetical protein